MSHFYCIISLLSIVFCITSQRVAAQAPLKHAVDISFLPEVEAGGGKFYDGGVEKKLPAILVDHGIDLARLHVWHTPPDGRFTLSQTVTLAKRLGQLGIPLFLDIMYSDTWANPSQQIKPKAWKTLKFGPLKQAVHDYTYDVMTTIFAAGITCTHVQIGNEIGGGFLWNDGKNWGRHDTDKQWTQLGELLQSARDGLRAAVSAAGVTSPAVIIHNEHGGDWGATQWFFNKLRPKFNDFDIIGLSFYPWWHGDLGDLHTNLVNLAAAYGKKVAVVETAYPWTEKAFNDGLENIFVDTDQLIAEFPPTEAGQAGFISEVLSIVSSVPEAVMLCYWAPGWIITPNIPSAWENQALFDWNGHALDGLDALAGTSSATPAPTTSHAPSGAPTLSNAPSVACSSFETRESCRGAGCKWSGRSGGTCS